MLEVPLFNDLLEIANMLLEKYSTFLPALNDINENEWCINIVNVPLSFTPLTDDKKITSIKIDNKDKYILCSFCSRIDGYAKESWVKKSPLYVYALFYNGEYTGDVFLTRKEAISFAKEVVEELVSEGFTLEYSDCD